MVLKYLLEKEFKQIGRNILIPGIIVIFVLIMLLLFPWAVSFEAKNIPLTIVNQDGSQSSLQLTQKIAANPSFVLNRVVRTYEEGYKDMESKSAIIMVVIPQHFGRDLLSSALPQVKVVANAVDGSQASLGAQYLNAIVADYSTQICEERLGKQGQTQLPLSIHPLYRFNPFLDYKAFMLPAFLVMLLTMICGIIPAMNIIIEKEVGTIQQINVTPIKSHTFILGKIIPFWVIGLVILGVSVLILGLLYNLWPAGSLTALFIGGLIYTTSISGMAILISNFSDTLQQGMFLILFFILILFLLSGLFTPINTMPWWAKGIAYLNPLTYFIRTMRMIYLKGAILTDVLPNIGILCLFGLALNGIAIATHKKRK